MSFIDVDITVPRSWSSLVSSVFDAPCKCSGAATALPVLSGAGPGGRVKPLGAPPVPVPPVTAEGAWTAVKCSWGAPPELCINIGEAGGVCRCCSWKLEMPWRWPSRCWEGVLWPWGETRGGTGGGASRDFMEGIVALRGNWGPSVGASRTEEWWVALREVGGA